MGQISTLFIYNIVLVLFIPIGVMIIIYAYKNRRMLAAKQFLLMVFWGLMYCITYILELNSTNPNWAKIWFYIKNINFIVLFFSWLLVSIEYIDIKKLGLTGKRLLTAFSLLNITVLLTNGQHHQYFTFIDFKSNGYSLYVIVTEKGPLYIAFLLVITLIYIFVLTLYFFGSVKSTNLKKYGYMLMFIAALIPLIPFIFSFTNTSYLSLDYFPLFISISCVVFLLAIFQYNLSHMLYIANQTIFQSSKEGILVYDVCDRIVDINNALMNIYPEFRGKGALKKKSYSDFINKHPEFASGFNEAGKLQYELIIDEETKYFFAEQIPVLSETGTEVGRMLYITDITFFAEKQKKMEAAAAEAKTRAKINEISFLQAQIKPHFLNNVFSVIASMITRQPEEAERLVLHLDEYLLNNYFFDNADMMPLQKELETVHTYIYIEQARFEERLSYELICDDIPDIEIPRLILQPLVENSIRHGIMKKIEGGIVSLSIIRDSRRVYFEIKDNGIGMSDEKVRSLFCETYDGPGIGIKNIHNRLVRYYGEGLYVESTEGLGTCIRFSVFDITSNIA